MRLGGDTRAEATSRSLPDQGAEGHQTRAIVTATAASGRRWPIARRPLGPRRAQPDWDRETRARQEVDSEVPREAPPPCRTNHPDKRSPPPEQPRGSRRCAQRRSRFWPSPRRAPSRTAPPSRAVAGWPAPSPTRRGRATASRDVGRRTGTQRRRPARAPPRAVPGERARARSRRSAAAHGRRPSKPRLSAETARMTS